MKKYKILSMLLIAFLIITSFNFVSAVSTNEIISGITISNGVKSGNKITFEINLPEKTSLRGDVLADGKVDASDAELLNNYVSEIIEMSEIDSIAADINLDGEIKVTDVNELNSSLLSGKGISEELLKKGKEQGYLTQTEEIEQLCSNAFKTPFVLEGTLASKSTAKITRSSNNKFAIEVTLPEGETQGTIGVTLIQTAFKNDQGKVNGFVSSNSYDISGGNNTEEPTKDPTKEPTEEPAKDPTEEPTKNPAQDPAKNPTGDNTIVDKKIPKAGVKNTIIFMTIGIAIIGVVAYIKSKTILK